MREAFSVQLEEWRHTMRFLLSWSRSMVHSYVSGRIQRTEDFAVNEKTAKILKKYADASKQDKKRVKSWWLSLNRDERARERARILKELNK